MKVKVALGVIAFLAALCSTPHALADSITTFSFNISGCSGVCAVPAGTVTLNDSGSGVTVTVALTPNQDFSIDTGSHYSFTFNLNKSSINAGPITDFLNNGSTTTTLGTSDFTFASTTAGSYTNSPFTGFNYAIQCLGCDPNLKQVKANAFSFTLNGISTADFIPADSYNGDKILFAADVLDVATGNTGAVAAALPEPSSVAFLSMGLTGLGLWRRRGPPEA